MRKRKDAGWSAELRQWLRPFVARLRRREQRRWPPVWALLDAAAHGAALGTGDED
jgi:hypothetical protein